jgi:hypothetical protein
MAEGAGELRVRQLPPARENDVTTFTHLALAGLLAMQVGAFASAESKEPKAAVPRHSIAVHGIARDGARIPDLPTPTPTPEPTKEPEQPQCGGWDCLLSQYDWPLWQARAVMLCESEGNPNAVSSAGAVGLFQIHPYNVANFDPDTNVERAYAKYLDGVRRGNPWLHWNQHGGCGWF